MKDVERPMSKFGRSEGRGGPVTVKLPTHLRTALEALQHSTAASDGISPCGANTPGAGRRADKFLNDLQRLHSVCGLKCFEIRRWDCGLGCHKAYLITVSGKELRQRIRVSVALWRTKVARRVWEAPIGGFYISCSEG